MLHLLPSHDGRGSAWSYAASFFAHLCFALVIAVPLRSLPRDPPKPPPATMAEVEVSQDEPRDESGFGTNRSTPAEVAARSHGVHRGPERALRLTSRRNAPEAVAAHLAPPSPRNEPIAQRSPEAYGEAVEAASVPVESLAAPYNVPLPNIGFPGGIEDPLDRVLGKRADREPVADVSAFAVQTQSVRTGPETTVVVSGPAGAGGAGPTDGFGAGTGGRRQWPGVDKSSPARLGGPVWWWYCPWPTEAEALPIRHAAAKLVVAVTSDGHATIARLTEAAAKTVVGSRMKRAGARFSQHGGQTVMLFRTSILSQRFAALHRELGATYEARVQQAA
ncbi:MAG: hypothetical protein ACLP1X_01180 [Polyangiaceae bacterium]